MNYLYQELVINSFLSFDIYTKFFSLCTTLKNCGLKTGQIKLY